MRRIAPLALALLLLCVPARAAGYPPVVDQSLTLTRAETIALARDARALADGYGLDVVILMVDSTGDAALDDYAVNWYEQNGYGQGLFKNGVMILLAKESHSYCIVSAGRGAANAVTSYAIDRTSEDIVPYFANGKYAEGFSRFVRDLGIVLAQAEAGAPYDADNPVDFGASPVVGGQTKSVGFPLSLLLVGGILTAILTGGF